MRKTEANLEKKKKKKKNINLPKTCGLKKTDKWAEMRTI